MELFIKKPKESKPKPKDEVVKKPEVKPTPKKEKKEEEKEEKKYSEPEFSNFKNAVVQSVLWKPESDNDGKVVVLITCDEMKTEDVKLRILNKKKRPIRANIRIAGRSNRLGHFKYARITYRVDQYAENLVKRSPLTLEFYHTLGEESETVLKRVRIKNPTKRVEM